MEKNLTVEKYRNKRLASKNFKKLRNFFLCDMHPDKHELQELSEKTGFSTKKIEKWFCNQRFQTKDQLK